MEQKSKIKRVAVLTSGGDSPGMNAAIRAVVRTAIYNKLEAVGVVRGYSGLINRQFMTMQSHSVSKIISLGGTMLKSSRCPEFKERSTRELAVSNMREAGIDALVVIGGDGSFRGADLLVKEFGFPVVGVPGTIDNDIYGTDYTIGFDTAINTAVSAIDKIRDTADSHNLVFFIEVSLPATVAEGGIKSELGIRPCAKIPQPTATLRTMPTDIKGYLHPPVAVVAGLASPFEQRVLVVDEQFALHGEGRRDAQVEKAAHRTAGTHATLSAVHPGMVEAAEGSLKQRASGDGKPLFARRILRPERHRRADEQKKSQEEECLVHLHNRF